MKKNILFIIIIQAFLLVTCEKDDTNYLIDDFIKAGQKSGDGVAYVDLESEISCTIVSPWEKTDTTINLDLNKDGILDFSIHGSMCDPSMLGSDCESWKIIPLSDNEVLVNAETNWLDTIPHLDPINSGNHWSHEESIIYSYYRETSGYSTNSGYWKSVLEADKYYVGVMIKKDKKQYYGWIGMKFTTELNPCLFLISDFAILKEYSK